MTRLIGRNKLAFLALCLSGLEASFALAEPSTTYNAKRVAEFAVGIFCKDGEKASLSVDPSTIKGSVERYSATPLLAEETQTVPAIERILFGVLAREKTDNGTVLIKVTHPPLGADGVTVERWETNMSTSERTMHAYYLGLSDGNPVGRWTIAGSSGGIRLFYAEFDVVPVDRNTIDPCTLKPIG